MISETSPEYDSQEAEAEVFPAGIVQAKKSCHLACKGLAREVLAGAPISACYTQNNAELRVPNGQIYTPYRPQKATAQERREA